MTKEIVKEVASDCLQQAELKKTANEITKLHTEVVTLGKKMAMNIFEMGHLLFEVSLHLTPSDFRKWLESELPFSERIAKNYVKVYLHFNEHLDVLQELTIMQAYAVAGVSARNEIDAPEKDEVEATLQEGETVYTVSADDTSENNEYIKALFKKPTLSGCNLKVHRTVFSGLKLWCYTRNTKQPTLLCDLLILPLPALDKDFQELRDTVQIQFEKYLMKLEELK